MKLEKIEKKVNKLIPSWVGDKHIPSIIRELNKTFHKSIIYFTSNRYDEEYFDHHSVIVSGQYCPRILSTIPENILITLSFPKNKKKVLITEKESENLALKIIRAKIGWRQSEAIFMYRMHFRKTDPKVWKRFLKKVYKNGKIK